ncbi:FAD:protein FMN transferase [Poseidonocella sp. HB161398]|uniref:FAD:protein FMN transferase n=1 Tax=Poseidonocella sp. HB161398 TaxID=2320855 RepID=UPI00110802E5|nr:FAD:protein FMN transferase [Poseidonocella sp. HB161398]
MTLTRRRFLSIAAAAAVLPAGARAAAWQGRAFGAEIALTLRGGPERTGPALKAALKEIRALERRFSLYDPGSDLSRLNAAGRLDAPDPDMVALLATCGRLHRLTGGRFDPTVQSLWTSPPGIPGWEQVALGPGSIRLGPGQALTLNGIAQGHAADRISALLAAHGFTDTLVDLGEFRSRGGPWRIGIADPAAGLLGQRSLGDGALATSSPDAMQLADGTGHIRDPRDPGRRPAWSTVSVEAASATLADGLSTAFCLMARAEIAALLPDLPEVARVVLVDAEGSLSTIAPPG